MPNIVNMFDVDRFINDTISRANSNAVEKWCRSNLRNYLLRDIGRWNRPMRDHIDYRGAARLAGQPVELPAWADKVVAAGGALDMFDFETYNAIDQSFGDQLIEAIDYLNVKYESDADSICRLSVPDALEASRQWHAGFTFYEGELGEEPAENFKTIRQFDNGYSIVELLTMDAFLREGRLMGHCVGGYFDRTSKSAAILSLRDEHNRPHATIEVAKRDANRPVIVQCKGKGNRPPVAKYHQYLRTFIIDRNYALYGGDTKKLGLIDVGGKIFGNSGDLLNWLDQPEQEKVRKEVNRTVDGRRHAILDYLMVHGNNLTEKQTDIALRVLRPTKGPVDIVATDEVYRLSDRYAIQVNTIIFPQPLLIFIIAHCRDRLQAYTAEALAAIVGRIAKKPYDIYKIERPSPYLTFEELVNATGSREKMATFRQMVASKKKRHWGICLSEAKQASRRQVDHKANVLQDVIRFNNVVIPRYESLMMSNEAL